MYFSIYRYNPETDAQPYMQEYTVDIPEGTDMMLLSVLNLIKEQDETLTYRRSCSEGVCGSDAMNINGKNYLACVTHVSQIHKPGSDASIVIRPLPGFPVIRDLVVDMTQFYAQYERAKPYLQSSFPAPAKERLQSPEERAKLDGLYECILCACCTSSCPSYWWNPDSFMGPAALLQAYRFIADSRETPEAKKQRLAAFGDDVYSLFRCRSIMNCVDACPKGLNPTAAIGEIRKEMLEESV